MENNKYVMKVESIPVRLEQLAEEAAELTQAALKLARKYRGESPTPKTKEECIRKLHEETADVMACLDCLLDVLDGASVMDRKHEKIERWAERLKRRE